jgi:hypothetical protein
MKFLAKLPQSCKSNLIPFKFGNSNWSIFCDQENKDFRVYYPKGHNPINDNGIVWSILAGPQYTQSDKSQGTYCLNLRLYINPDPDAIPAVLERELYKSRFCYTLEPNLFHASFTTIKPQILLGYTFYRS